MDLKIDEDIKKETWHIALGVGLLSILMVGVFALIGKFDASVVWGALLGWGAAVLNFFLLGLSVQKVAKAPADQQEHAKSIFKLSYSLRMLFFGGVIVLALVMDQFNVVAVVLPLLFLRFVTVAINMVYSKKERGDSSGGN